MSIEGRINIDALFHDKDGTASLKVVSLESSNAYTSGKVAIITGTAGTAQTSIAVSGVYRDASGQLVEIVPQRLAFSWDGVNSRLLEGKDDTNTVNLLVRSRRGETSVVTSIGSTSYVLRSSGGNTGTYTILMYEPEAT